MFSLSTNILTRLDPTSRGLNRLINQYWLLITDSNHILCQVTESDQRLKHEHLFQNMSELQLHCEEEAAPSGEPGLSYCDTNPTTPFRGQRSEDRSTDSVRLKGTLAVFI